MTSSRHLQLLESSFNAIAKTWHDTRTGTYLKTEEPGFKQYFSGVSYVFSNAVRKSADALGDFAVNPEHTVSLRRHAVSHLVTTGLESPLADQSMQTCTFYVLQRVYEAERLVPFAPEIGTRIGALWFGGSSSTDEILRRQQARLVAELTGKPAPEYQGGIRAGQVYTPPQRPVNI